MSARFLVASALLFVGVSACSTHPATQAIVSFHAEAELRSLAASIRVRVEGPDGATVLDANNPIGGGAAAALARVPLVPKDGDPGRTFLIEAELLDASSAILARVSAVGGYTRHELRELVLWFDDECAGVTDCGPARTCDRGVCVGACFHPTAPGDVDRSVPTCGECQECAGGACAPRPDDSQCGCPATDRCNAGSCVTTMDVRSVVGGHRHSCAIAGASGLHCWGSNNTGRLGLGMGAGSTSTPAPVSLSRAGPGTAGTDHTCWLTYTGERLCWGWNGGAQLGLGHVDGGAYGTPTPGPAGEPGWDAIDSDWSFTCALAVDGSIHCWGSNEYGQSGVDPDLLEVVMTPTAVDDAHDYLAVAAGAHHGCGLRSDGRLFCWGNNTNGELGVGDSISRFQPIQTGCVDGRCIDDWVSVAAGDTHTCAIREGGELWCWGGGSLGQLGVSGRADEDSSWPLRVDAGRFKSVAAHGSRTCAIGTDDSLWCWGRNMCGELGLGHLQQRSVPARVTTPGGAHFRELGLGRFHTCAIRTDGTLWCWGLNDLAQLGLGFESPGDDRCRDGAAGVSTPRRVCFPAP